MLEQSLHPVFCTYIRFLDACLLSVSCTRFYVCMPRTHFYTAIMSWLRPSLGDTLLISGFHAGNTMTLVWESRELMAVRTAFRRLLARSASIQTVQLALYATVSGLCTNARADSDLPTHYSLNLQFRTQRYFTTSCIN